MQKTKDRQPISARLQQHLQQVSFKMTHQQLKRRLFKKHQHNQSLQGLKPTPVQGVPNQAVRPQAGFANGQAGQQVAFANGQPLQPGQNIQFINGQAVVVPAQPSAFATTFKNYWTGLLNAWRRPADMTDYGKHNAWLNYIFLSFFTGLAFFTILSAIARKVVNTLTEEEHNLTKLILFHKQHKFFLATTPPFAIQLFIDYIK